MTTRRGPGDPPGAPISQLAVASLVCALVLLCPLTSVAAVILGSIAMSRIRMSRGRLGGRRLAIAGTRIGSATLVLQGAAIVQLAGWQQRSIHKQAIDAVTRTIISAQDGQLSEARNSMVPSIAKTISDDDIRSFGQSLMERYGQLERFSVANLERTGSVWHPRFEIAGFFKFANAHLPGSVTFQAEPSTTSVIPQLHLDGITINDAEHGSVHFPPHPVQRPTPATEPLRD